MKCKAKIIVECNSSVLHAALEPEKMKTKRGIVKIAEYDGSLEFTVEAVDTAAFRAMLNTVNNAITMYEQLENGIR